MPASRVAPLLHHEVGVHLLTFINGSKQGLNIFKRGLAGYEGVQEGLGVFAEWAVGGLTRTRLRLLAARVVAVDAMTDRADFIEVFRLLRSEHGFSSHTAFLIAARVFRGGGFAKDAIYLRGFTTVLDRIAAGETARPLLVRQDRPAPSRRGRRAGRARPPAPAGAHARIPRRPRAPRRGSPPSARPPPTPPSFRPEPAC